MNKLYIFEFNRIEHLKVWKVLVVHYNQKRVIDEVKKNFGDPAIWVEGYKIKQLGEIDRSPGIIIKEIYLDPKKMEVEG